MTEMKPLIIAKRAPQDHANGADGQWWSEYRVRTLTDAERNSDRTYRYRYALEQRYCHDIDSEYCTHHTGQWCVWDYGKTLRQTVASCAGDTHYMEADSVHGLHARMIRAWRRRQRLERAMDVLYHATHEEIRPWAMTSSTYQELDVYADEREQAEARYMQELKRARLYTAAMDGKADPAKVNAIKSRVLGDFERRLAEQRRRHAAMLQKYRELSEKLAARDNV